MSEENLSVENLIQEDALCEILTCTKGQLARLRNEENLPFVKISRYCRVYLEPDLMKWLKNRSVVLNKVRSADD